MAENPTQIEELLKFLRIHDIAAIATINDGGIVHATTVFYYVEEDLKFYFLTKYETLKFKNLSKNTNTALVISDEKLYQTVQVEGVATEVDYAHEYAPTVKKFIDNLERNGRNWEGMPLNHISAGYYAFVQVSPTWIRWVDFKNWEHSVKFEQRF